MKILIIKLGFSETLDAEIGKIPSLGDILRTTPILSVLKDKYPKSHISWVVTEKGYPLLYNNSFIDRILIWDEFLQYQLIKEKYDVVINLEKIPGVCALVDMIEAWEKFGFRFDSETGGYRAYEKGIQILDYINEKRKNKDVKDYWQKVLIDMLGGVWNNQKYILGYEPKSKEIYDIGFNYKVGEKWPTKIMCEEKWLELELKLKKSNFKISWQKGLDNLYEYMDWINSCKIIITHDSLGLHLALALNKKVISLFGPTAPQEIFLYGNSLVIQPEIECGKMPCYSSKCLTGETCMNNINTDKIMNTIKKLND